MPGCRLRKSALELLRHDSSCDGYCNSPKEVVGPSSSPYVSLRKLNALMSSESVTLSDLSCPPFSVSCAGTKTNHQGRFRKDDPFTVSVE